MNHLSQQEQELILDFYFRCGQDQSIDRGRDLIAASPGAAKLYAKLEESLTDLDSIKYEPCPDNLVDLTIARLKLAASVTQNQQPSTTTQRPFKLHELLQKERETPVAAAAESSWMPVVSKEPKNIKFHHRVIEFLATAAAVVLIFSVLFPAAGAMRQHSRKVVCADNFRQIGQALASFTNEHKTAPAQATVQAGAPWWKIGYQGPESYSNTRYPWQLVKQGYVSGKVFVCRGNIGAKPVQYDSGRMGNLVDFPSRNNISYSFILFCDKNAEAMQSRKVIAGDLNPVFQKIPSGQTIYDKLNEFENILRNEQLRQMLSSSHTGKGQNVLRGDGGVEWIKVRVVNDDDIYTIRGVDAYTGKETPADDNDIFLAP